MTDAADDTFARLTEYEPVYQMDVAAGALELGFGTSQDDERVSLSRVDSMLLECEESEHVVDRIWPASSLTFEEPDGGAHRRLICGRVHLQPTCGSRSCCPRQQVLLRPLRPGRPGAAGLLKVLAPPPRAAVLRDSSSSAQDA
jgi:hypothetical protein